MSDPNVVGRSLARVDGRSKVTGQTRFSGDLAVPGMLYGGTLRSPHPHARLVRLNVEKARAVDGVRAVVTAKDLPGTGVFGVVNPDQPVLVPVGGTVRMLGDPVAILAAESEAIAEQVLALIEVEYEPLPVVADPVSAIDPSAPQLFPDKPGNVCAEFHLEAGDVERAMAQADAIVDRVYRTPRQEHAYLEPEAGLATLEPDGTLVVYTGAQDTAFYLRTPIATALNWPENKVRVIAMPTGGAFGGKTEPSLQIHVALLAAKTGRPVKMVWSREESLLASTKRHPMTIRHRLGVTREGRIVAIDAHVVADAGAYTSCSPWVLDVACRQLAGPYAVENVRIEGQAIFTDNPVSGALRGYGEPQAMLVTECQIAQAVRELNLDPQYFRLANAVEEGAVPPLYTLPVQGKVSLQDTVASACRRAGPRPEPSGPAMRVGRGIACVMPGFDVGGTPWGAMAGAGARLELFRDGSLLVHSGVCEIGTGVTTVLVQIAAESLGLEPGAVSIVYGDSATTPKSGPAVASRSAICSGNAVRWAAGDLRRKLLAKAAEMLRVEVDQLAYGRGRISVREHPDVCVTLAEVAAHCHNTGVSLVAESWYHIDHPDNAHSFTTAIADVAVDTETGVVQLLRLIVAHDAGRALNPSLVKGQLVGGALMGAGWALMEDAPAEGGRLLPSSLADYLVPTSLDIRTEIESIIVEEPLSLGPFGARGVGEASTGAVPPAIINALYDAIGVMITELPATPEAVLWAIQRGGITECGTL